MTVKIYPDVEDKNIRQLAVQVCLRAIKELKGKDVFAALDAFLWLASDDFPTWAEVAGIPFADPLTLVNSERFRRLWV